ncbi:unnamed protein product [Hyaloperonospora brassicae]|uniref:RxLR effector candidate protein n=2 Tax=Hyaloperonospora brassicae TaxID=162125 RepID=A0AAV0UXN3_HYABA|nr:unnamed protein product [Hyaloperonospora brassicae]
MRLYLHAVLISWVLLNNADPASGLIQPKAAASGEPHEHNEASRLRSQATDETDQDERMMQVPRGMVLPNDVIEILRQFSQLSLHHEMPVPPSALRGKVLGLPSSQVIEEIEKLKSADFSRDTMVMEVYTPILVFLAHKKLPDDILAQLMIHLVDQMNSVTAPLFVKLAQRFKELETAAEAAIAHLSSRYGATSVGPSRNIEAFISKMEAEGNLVSALYLRRFADEFAEWQKKQTTATHLVGN